MSNSKLVRPFDDICCLENILQEYTDDELRSFLKYARNCAVSDIQQKIATMEETNARMRKDLDLALKRKEQLERQVTNATLVLKQERKENKRALQRRDRMRQKLDNLANHVMESREIPQTMKEIVSQKLSNFDRIGTIHAWSSDSDASAIACSCSDTESDNWHLFPGCSRHSSVVSSIHLSTQTSAATSSDNCSNSSIVIFGEIWDSIKSRPHEYKSKIVVMGDNCMVCDTRLQCGHHAQKCISCKAIVHEKCHDHLPKPCIPTPVMKRNASDLKDFCPPTPFKPMIPGIIFHAAHYIESHGLNLSGLYGLQVYDSNLKSLKDKFYKGKGVPNLNNFHPRVVAAFLKEFLSSLNPPLIPGTHFQRLVKHVRAERKENPSYDDLMEDLFQLPIQNRDTLAFLILHLQKVANSPNCKMNSYMVSKTFTPVLVENFNSKTFSEEKLQRKVIQQMIDMPEEIWKRVLASSCT